MEVGVHDYVIFEHLQIADNQGDAALRMGNSEASRTLYQIRFLLLQSLSMVLKRYHNITKVRYQLITKHDISACVAVQFS